MAELKGRFMVFSKMITATGSATVSTQFTAPQGKPDVTAVSVLVATTTITDAYSVTITLNVNGVDLISADNGAAYAMIAGPLDRETRFRIAPGTIPPGSTLTSTLINASGTSVNVIYRLHYD